MIRKYRDTDLDDLLAVWYSASQIGHSFLTEEFFAKERKNIANQYLPNSETWIYEQDGKVVAFIAMLEDEVGGLFVGSDYQRSGIGKALIDYVRSSREFLELNVFEENLIGRRFYEKNGFRKIGRRVDRETGRIQHRLRLKC